jgi:hypothetical protein
MPIFPAVTQNADQATPEQPPAAPAAPTAPSAPGAAPAIAGLPRQYTRADLPGLRDRRSELSRQIESASERREEAVEALKTAPPAARAGLEGRIAVLDQRIMKLEEDIAANGQALAAAQLGGGSESGTEVPAQRYGPFSSGQLTAISIVSIVMIWGPLAWAATRVMVRRWAHAKPAPQILESSARLERMEQAIEAVAIEIERISEGQRFVTQSLAKPREAVPVLPTSPSGSSAS